VVALRHVLVRFIKASWPFLLSISLPAVLIMPEIRECIAHFLFLLWFYEYCLENHLDLTLLGLWADAPDNNPGEQKLANGSVYKLEATSTAARGTNGAQTFMWPSMWCKTALQVDPPTLDRLKLQGVDRTNRAIIMDMGELKFQVRISLFSFYFHKQIVFIACILDTHHDPNFYETTMGNCSLFIKEKGV